MQNHTNTTLVFALIWFTLSWQKFTAHPCYWLADESPIGY